MVLQLYTLYFAGADGHKTEYSVPLLKQLMENRKKANNEVVYWDQQKLSSLTDIKVTCKEYFDSEDGQIRLYKSILKYGFGLVTGVNIHSIFYLFP